MKTQNLKESVVLQIRTNDDVLYKIAQTMNRRLGTVRNWCYRNDSMLYAPPVLEIISQFTGIAIEDLQEESKEKALTK